MSYISGFDIIFYKQKEKKKLDHITQHILYDMNNISQFVMSTIVNAEIWSNNNN